MKIIREKIGRVLFSGIASIPQTEFFSRNLLKNPQGPNYTDSRGFKMTRSVICLRSGIGCRMNSVQIMKQSYSITHWARHVSMSLQQPQWVMSGTRNAYLWTIASKVSILTKVINQSRNAPMQWNADHLHCRMMVVKNEKSSLGVRSIRFNSMGLDTEPWPNARVLHVKWTNNAITHQRGLRLCTLGASLCLVKAFFTDNLGSHMVVFVPQK